MSQSNRILPALLVLFVMISTSAFAAPEGNPGRPHRSCQKIANACRGAGFAAGDWKNGDGLWRDCVDPIIQGATAVPGATKPLPTVPPALIAECKLHHPKFGEGKVGSIPGAAQPGTPAPVTN